MKFPIRWITLPALVQPLTVLLCLFVAWPANLLAATDSSAWVATWATSPFGGDPWHAPPALVNSTLREIVHTSIAGKQLRIRFTNEFGTEPLRIDAATVAISAGRSDIKSDTLHTLTFGKAPSIVIPPGALAVSDPVDMVSPPFTDLAVSLYLPLQRISDLSTHSSANQDNFIQPGNSVTASSLADPVTMQSWFFLKGVDALPIEANAGAVVAFGDSITDGAYAQTNKNERWPDDLARRLQENRATAGLSVLNEGIGGNCILGRCVGPNALARYDRDTLAQPGVKYVIVLEGINDIGALHNPNQPDFTLTAEDLEIGLLQLIVRAHERDIKIFGATITPFEGCGYYTEQGEKIREAVNDWMRTSGAFDGVVDFDKATRDPAHLHRLLAAYDSGDHLHPKGTGLAAMANAINLELFR